MRRAPISQAVAEEEEINITPMLDVVFILLRGPFSVARVGA